VDPTSRVTISSDSLLAEVDPHGAELVRLSTRDGHELLWDGDPAFWTGHAPILFPIVGMLNQGRYRFNNETYPMPKHGFARNSRFEQVDCSSDGVTLAIEDNDTTRTKYPFAFRLGISFKINGTTLGVIARVNNRGAGPMPVSFGFHPALRWPLPFGAARADHRVIFSLDEPAPIRRINAAGLLEDRPYASPVVGRTLRLQDQLFVDDAIIFDRLRSNSLSYGAEGFPEILLTFANLPNLGIWTKPGAGFVCLEPWQGHSDPQGFGGDIWSKPGIIAVAPSATQSFAMNLSVEDPAA
jgi:galactose mutarotase-like enzyme